MAINGINSSSFNFGSYSSIKKQAEEIAKRVESESAARKAKQEATGLMKNAHGDIVEISSIPKWEREELERRERANSVSPREAMLGFLATDPDAERVAKNIELADKFIAIRSKLQSGQKLSGAEKSFLQENFPELASMADKMEQEENQLKVSLRGAKSKEQAEQIYMDAKMRILSNISENDSSGLFLLSVIDKVYCEYKKN